MASLHQGKCIGGVPWHPYTRGIVSIVSVDRGLYRPDVNGFQYTPGDYIARVFLVSSTHQGTVQARSPLFPIHTRGLYSPDVPLFPVHNRWTVARVFYVLSIHQGTV